MNKEMLGMTFMISFLFIFTLLMVSYFSKGLEVSLETLLSLPFQMAYIIGMIGVILYIMSLSDPEEKEQEIGKD